MTPLAEQAEEYAEPLAPEQQRAMHAHLLTIKRQHNADLREAERDSRDAYHEGRSNAAAEARGEPYGTY